MKRLLIILIWAAAASVSHAQVVYPEKTFRYLRHGSQSVWLDEDIIGDANRIGKWTPQP
jgi:hypothetical protein